jgi:hypothetical protein
MSFFTSNFFEKICPFLLFFFSSEFLPSVSLEVLSDVLDFSSVSLTSSVSKRVPVSSSALDDFKVSEEFASSSYVDSDVFPSSDPSPVDTLPLSSTGSATVVIAPHTHERLVCLDRLPDVYASTRPIFCPNLIEPISSLFCYDFY